MSRTVPSFRMVLETEKAEWKPFRNALNNKKERKEFDDMFDIPRSYLPACSNSVSLVPLQPIMISILFQHYTQLMELKAQVQQQIEGRVGEEDADVTAPTNNSTLDSYLMINNSFDNLSCTLKKRKKEKGRKWCEFLQPKKAIQA